MSWFRVALARVLRVNKWLLYVAATTALVFFTISFEKPASTASGPVGLTIKEGKAGQNITSASTSSPIVYTESQYAAIPYFHFELLKRYQAYLVVRQDLSPHDIVWHVNAGLDRAPYTTMNETASDYPLLVNSRNKLPDEYIPKELTAVSEGIDVTPGTADAFRRMLDAAAKDGIFIEAELGYRSLNRQKSLFEQTALVSGTTVTESPIVQPGCDEHNTGRAIDLVSSGAPESYDETEEYLWIRQNCAKYGFIIRYQKETSEITGFDYEPQHITFVGRAVAQDMETRGIETLEEYVAKGFAPLNGTVIDDRPLIVVDAGHGGNDDGAVASLSGQYYYEKDLNLDIAERLKVSLELEDIRVILTRDSDTYVELIDRTRIANTSGASAFISIHNNFDEEYSSRGVQTWYHDVAPDNELFATTIHEHLLSELDAGDEGLIESGRQFVVRSTRIPAVLVESGFMSDRGELRLLSDPEYRQRIAEALSKGIIAFLDEDISLADGIQ